MFLPFFKIQFVHASSDREWDPKFLCYINDIFSATSLATFLFTDDTSCLAENSNLHDLITHVNTELNKLAVWFKANKMVVNVSKTNYIIFHARGKQVNLNGRDIIFNSNEISEITPDPSLIQKIRASS